MHTVDLQDRVARQRLRCPACRASVALALSLSRWAPEGAVRRCLACAAEVELRGEPGDGSHLEVREGAAALVRRRVASVLTSTGLWALVLGVAGSLAVLVALDHGQAGPALWVAALLGVHLAAQLAHHGAFEEVRSEESLTASGSELVLVERIGDRSRERRYPAADVEQLFVREIEGVPYLWLRRRSVGGATPLWRGPTARQLRGAEVEFERRLGVPDRLVQGELRWDREVALVAPTTRRPPPVEGCASVEVVEATTGAAPRCPVCAEPSGAAARGCGGCDVLVHRDCFAYAGCGTYGCVGAG